MGIFEPSDILQMDTGMLWNYYKNIGSEDPNINKVKLGIDIKFHIKRYIENNIKLKSKSGEYVDVKNRQKIDDEAMYDEIDKRENYMRDFIFEQLDTKKFTRRIEKDAIQQT